MAEQKYKTGEVVQLRSGGPRMTVKGYSESAHTVFCQWFAGSKLESGGFPEESLDHPPAPAKKNEL